MGIEYELKFRANDAIQAQLRQTEPGQERLYRMQTTYYDTPTGQLSARFYTLRTRLENDTSVCTLKAPAAGHGRGEWELECDDIEKAIPELCKLGAPADLEELVKEGIVAICGARFTRIAKTVELPECTVELALDKGVLTGGGKEVPLCEVEVELKSGSQTACALYAKLLAAKLGMEPESKSKFRRALALYQGD